MPFARRTVALLAVVIPLAAQQGAIGYKNLRHSPPGQYQQELQGSMDGQPSGADQHPDQLRRDANRRPRRLNHRHGQPRSRPCRAAACTSSSDDEPNLAESEQVCNRGSAQQVIHTTIHVIDDKTQRVETVSTLGPHKMTAISTVRYLGPCTAEQKAENARAMAAAPAMTAAPAMPSLTPAQCAAFASNKREMTDAIKGLRRHPRRPAPHLRRHHEGRRRTPRQNARRLPPANANTQT